MSVSSPNEEVRRTMLELIRNGTLGLFVCFAGLASSPATAAEGVAEQQTKLIATVKVEIKQESGKVIKTEPRTIEWDEQNNVRLESDGHVHDVSLQVRKQDDAAKKLSITMAYELDGDPVIAPFEFDTTAKKREIVRTDGGVALAITVTPKRVKIEAPKKRDKLEGGDADEPLDGLKPKK